MRVSVTNQSVVPAGGADEAGVVAKGSDGEGDGGKVRRCPAFHHGGQTAKEVWAEAEATADHDDTGSEGHGQVGDSYGGRGDGFVPDPGGFEITGLGVRVDGMAVEGTEAGRLGQAGEAAA